MDKLTQWHGKPHLQAHGVKVWIIPKKAKTSRGRDSVWVNIRTDDDDEWTQAESLAYVHGADIQFRKPEK